MSTFAKDSECAFCSHTYRDHLDNDGFCSSPECECVEFVSEEEMYEDREDGELDAEDIETIVTCLKSSLFLTNSIRTSLKYLPDNEWSKSVITNVSRACYGLEKIAAVIAVYLDTELPDIATIEAEFNERKEFEKLLSL